MLSKVLCNLCVLLTTPYNNLNLISDNVDYLDSSILEEIYFKKLFSFKWRKKVNSLFGKYHFDYNYAILEENSDLIKIKLNLKISFFIANSNADIPSACIREYIIILEHLHGKFKLRFLVENEENPLLYNYALNTDLYHISSFIFSQNQDLYMNEIPSMDLLYDTFMASISNPTPEDYARKNSNLNVAEACNYAEKYALNYNPNYKSFSGLGGDCTNFMSQILHAGGFKYTSTWKPYTHAWIRVQESYVYLTTNGLGTKLPHDKSLDRGCLIQFYTPSIGRFFHNGFITYKLQNGDCLYCCHSYDKLNYPLSEIYPHRYPKLRALKFI